MAWPPGLPTTVEPFLEKSIDRMKPQRAPTGRRHRPRARIISAPPQVCRSCRNAGGWRRASPQRRRPPSSRSMRMPRAAAHSPRRARSTHNSRVLLPSGPSLVSQGRRPAACPLYSVLSDRGSACRTLPSVRRRAPGIMLHPPLVLTLTSCAVAPYPCGVARHFWYQYPVQGQGCPVPPAHRASGPPSWPAKSWAECQAQGAAEAPGAHAPGADTSRLRDRGSAPPAQGRTSPAR